MPAPTTADEQKSLREEFTQSSQQEPFAAPYTEWLELLVIELRHALGVARAESHRQRIYERHNRTDRPPGPHLITP